MFLKRKMNNSTNSYSDKILQIKDKIGEADAIIIGAGAGLSAPDVCSSDLRTNRSGKDHASV